MMRIPGPANTLWLLAALLLNACATTTERLDDLDRTLRGYEKAIRWAQFDSAYAFRKWEPGTQPIPPEALKNIRVTQYRVNSTHLAIDKMSYSQVVTIYYYRLDSPRERHLIDRQQWQYFSEQKRWHLVSDMPPFL